MGARRAGSYNAFMSQGPVWKSMMWLSPILQLLLMLCGPCLCSSNTSVKVAPTTTSPPSTSTLMSVSTTASSDGTATSHQPNVPTNSTIPPFEPVSPASQVKYRMSLSKPGPAVLDSDLDFTAHLIPEDVNNTDHWPTKFVYQWMNMATMRVHETVDKLTSHLTLYFNSNDYIAGEYLITVAAFFKDDPTKMAAFQVTKFTLTDKLNGHLELQQSTGYQRFPHVFSTNRQVTLFTDLQDHFRKDYNLSYSYYWYQDGEFINCTKFPVLSITVREAKNFTLMALVLAEFSQSVSQQNSVPESVSNDCGVDARKLKDNGDDPVIKDGKFTQQVGFKDPLDDCVVLRVDAERGDRSVKVGVPILLNITCLGSGPSSVCLNITEFNGTVPDNKTCQPRTFVDTVRHQVQFVLNSTGWSDVHFYIYNDVSISHKQDSFFAYEPDTENVPVLVFPLVFGFLGLTIFIIGAVYIMKLRKKPLVEVADFDFHPYLTTSVREDTGVRFTRFTNTLKHMFFRNRHQSQHRSPPPTKASVLTEDSTDIKSLYGSL